MSTIKDIASMSGYSIATVSRALNNQRNVDPEIQKKVLQCAQDLNYRPNVIGQMLRTQGSNLIMCIIPPVNEGIVYEGYEEMQNQLLQRGYHMILYPFLTATDDCTDLLKIIDSGILAGIIFVVPVLDSETLSELNRRTPLVQMGEYDIHTVTSIVSLDYSAASRDLLMHLVHLGHRCIASISFDTENISSIQKLQGYKLALDELKIPIDSELIKNVSYGVDSSFETAVTELMSLEKKPTAIMCHSDRLAAKCIRVLNQMGISVPNDCAVVGFDNSDISQLVTPAITTVGASFRQMGVRTIEILLSQIELKETRNEKVYIPYKLYIRDSDKAI